MRKVMGALAAAAVLAGVPRPDGVTAAGMTDFWGPLHDLRTSDGYPVLAMHLARLCDGRTLLMGFDRGRPDGQYRSATGMIVPQTLSQVVAAPTTAITRTVQKMPLPLDLLFDAGNPLLYDVNICGGAAFTESGSLKVGGMSRYARDGGPQGTVILGVPYSIELDATGVTWRRLPNEFVGTGEAERNWRWYPTYTRVAFPATRSTAILVTAGSLAVDPFRLFAPPSDPNKIYWYNDSIELDDGSGTNRLVVPHGDSHPDIRNETGYPHVIRQPDGTQVIHGEAGRPATLTIDTGVLTPGAQTRPGPEVDKRSDTSSTSPLSVYWNNSGPYPNGSFITCGGRAGTPYESSCAVHNALTRTWTHFEMGVKRTWPTTKLLPDGRVAIMGGVASDGSSGQGLTQIFDPVASTMQTGTSEMATQRGYHTAGVLQNDGSVFLCAGYPMLFDPLALTASLEAPTCQTYWPDYIWKRKPYIASVPQTIALGATFNVRWYDGSNLSPVVDARLMALPTDTHGFDSGQSNVQLRVVKSVPVAGSPNIHTVTLQLPQPASGTVADTAHILPPGCYTLFLIDAQRVPSLGARTKVVW